MLRAAGRPLTVVRFIPFGKGAEALTDGYFRGEGRNAIYILVNTGVDDCDLRVPVVSEGRFRVLLQTDESRQERALISTEKEAQPHFLNEDVIHYKGYLNVTLAPYSAVIFKEDQTKEGIL